MNAAWHTSLQTLQKYGFTGFLTLRELRDSNLVAVPGEPGDFGVYVILRLDETRPIFLAKSTGGLHKGKDPNVPLAILKARWLDGIRIVYIGKGGGPGIKDQLRDRLKSYLNFGLGKNCGHWGGRRIWHIAESEKLVACWKLTPNQIPYQLEQQMLREFKAAYGDFPFANGR